MMNSKQWGDDPRPVTKPLPAGIDLDAKIAEREALEAKYDQEAEEKRKVAELGPLRKEKARREQAAQAHANLQATLAEVKAGFAELQPECERVRQLYDEVLTTCAEFVTEARRVSDRGIDLVYKVKQATDATGQPFQLAQHLAACGGTSEALRLMPAQYELREGSLDRILVELAREPGKITFSPKLNWNKMFRF